jgi:hypothetical protein
MGKPAKVVKNTYPVEETVQSIPPGGVAPIQTTRKKYFVDVEFPDEPGQIRTIPRKWIVEKTRTPESIPFENPRLVRFISDMFFPSSIPVKEWSAENARLALGGFLGVREKMPRGKLAEVGKTTGGLVWDAMRNNPEDAPRILSHEAGHILAEIDAPNLKNLGISEFEGFKGWLKEEVTNNDPAAQTRYQQAKAKDPTLDFEDFILTEKYGDELKTFWNGWSLFKSKTPNARELAANALSIFMNDQMGGAGVPSFRSSKIRASLQNWVDSQPNLKLAFEGLRAYDFQGADSINNFTTDMRRKADTGLVEAAKAQRGEGPTFVQEMVNNLQNKFYSFLDRMKHDPAAVDRLDKNLMIPGRAAHFVDIGFGETLKQLGKAGVDFEHYNNYLLFNRILSGNRTKTVERLIANTPYKDQAAYREVYEYETQRIREDILDNYPDLSDAEVESRVRGYMETYSSFDVVKEFVDMLNPGGLDKDAAAQGLVELTAKYGPEKMALMEQRRKAEHQAFVDYTIPVLRESKLFSERTLNQMENNSDYATFVIAHHAFNAKKNGKRNPGSLDFIHEQQGTLGFVASPHPQMTELRMRMMLAADQAGMTRDLVEMSNDFEAQHFPDSPRTYKLGQTEKPKSGYEVFTSKKYNRETGQVEPVRYAVKIGSLDAFTKLAENSTFWSGLSAIHGAMKGWMTIYNPRFWLTNWLRDTARTAINAPGLKSLYEIPVRSAFALAEDVAYRAQGKENPEYQKMLQDYQIAGDVKSYARSDSTMSAQDRVMKMADINPAFYKKTWGEIEGFFNKLEYLYAKATDPIRRFSAQAGGAVEFSSKAAMKRYLDKHYSKMSKEEKNWYIRNAAGTPVLGRSGNWNPYLSNMLLFYNPNMQGYAGDIEALRRDPLANLMKRAATVIPYMMLLGAARSGFINKDMKEWAEGIPGKYFGRGFILPTGFSADKDSGTITIPTDPITRMMLTASYQTMNKLMTGTFSATDLGGSILGEAAEGLPSVTPLYKTLESAGTYMVGGNPEDFMGRPAIDPPIFASDENNLKRLSMLTHIGQQGWFGPLNSLGFTNLARMKLSERMPKPEIPVERRTTPQQINTAIKTLANFPITNVLGGLFKFTSAGNKELAELRSAPTVARLNSEKLAVGRTVNKILSKEQLTPAEISLLSDKRHLNRALSQIEDALELKAIAASDYDSILPLIRQLQYNPDQATAAQYWLMIGERLKKK